MEDTEERSLLLWIKSFDDKVEADGDAVVTLEDLSDGIFLSHVMHVIGAESINLDLINNNAADNWALKANNLKTLLRAIKLFYHDELGQVCDAQELIDATLIAQTEDPKEICRLIELLLGCAVQGPNKSEYIHPIMQMEAVEQASMMHTIDDLMSRFQLVSPQQHHNRNSMGYLNHEGESNESMRVQLTQALERVSQMELRFLDVEREKRELTERLENVLLEKKTLEITYVTLEGERDKLVSERQSTLARDNKKIQQIVEGEIHALTVHLEEKKDELNRVKRESAERMMTLEHEVRRQADELDISRSKISQLGKLEASVTKYKKRLEEMNALRTQVKDLEAHNAQYLDKVLDLESTVKTIPAMKTLVEKYKNQVVELETANVEASSSNQIKEQKIRRLQEELDSAMAGKEFLENQVDELRGQLASLHHHHGQDDDDEGHEMEATLAGSVHSVGRRTHGSGSRSSSSSMDSMSNGLSGSHSGGAYSTAEFVLGNDSVAHLRERVARLERENSDLKRGGENVEQSHLTNELDMALKSKEALQAMLHELKRQNDQLFEELEMVRQRQSEAGGRNSEAQSVGGRTGSFSTRSSPSASPGKPDKLAEYEDLISQLRLKAEDADTMKVTVMELTNRLKEKESVINEVSEQRAKLENYTKKTLHAVQTKYMVAVSSHRNQLNEKQERIDFMEKKMKETRASYSREQALMMSGFYEIGTEMQRRTMMPQVPSQGAQPAAWLASKRTEERNKRRQV